MSKNIGFGDKLARGAVKAVYSSTEGGISADKWNDIFDSYDPEAFRAAPNKSSQRTASDSDTDGQTSGTTGADLGEVVREPTTL